MHVLPAGKRKYLLINRHEVSRNYERQTNGGPVAVVVIPDEGKTYEGFGVLADGPVALDYDQSGPPLYELIDSYTSFREVARAVYATDGRVAIAESWGEVASLTLNQPEKPAKPTKKTGEQ